MGRLLQEATECRELLKNMLKHVRAKAKQGQAWARGRGVRIVFRSILGLVQLMHNKQGVSTYVYNVNSTCYLKISHAWKFDQMADSSSCIPKNGINVKCFRSHITRDKIFYFYETDNV